VILDMANSGSFGFFDILLHGNHSCRRESKRSEAQKQLDLVKIHDGPRC
jgi:hypothetical protein